jgi:hypothetical protein
MAEDYKPKTAQDNVNALGPLVTDLENAKRAKEEGVLHEGFVGYEEALKNYESRSDVETLEQRLAREVGPDFETAHFARETGVLLGRDDKVLDEDDPVKAAEDSAKRVEESEQWKRDQAAHTADKAAEHNEATVVKNDDEDDK